MPPKTAIRSGIAASARGVGAERAVLIAGVTGLMAEGICGHRFRQGRAEAGVGGVDQNRTNVNTLVGDDATVVADQTAFIESVHHVQGDAFFRAIAALPFNLRADAKGWKDFEAGSFVALGLE